MRNAFALTSVFAMLACSSAHAQVSPLQAQTDVNAKLASGKPGGYSAADLRSVFINDFLGTTYLSVNPTTGKLTYFNGTAFVPYTPLSIGTPASSSAPCFPGQQMADASYHYDCIATNTWQRVATSPF